MKQNRYTYILLTISLMLGLITVTKANTALQQEKHPDYILKLGSYTPTINIDLRDSTLSLNSAISDELDRAISANATGSNPIESILTLSEQMCIQASKYHPKAYGFIVNYIYNGFEQNGLSQGAEILAKHIDKRRCRLENNQRENITAFINRATKLTPGTQISFKEISFPTNSKPYRIVFFWSLDCEHCHNDITLLNRWYQDKVKGCSSVADIATFAVEGDPIEWGRFTREALPQEWHNTLKSDGYNHPDAKSLYVTSTPQFYVLDNDMKIVLVPRDIRELIKFFWQQ